MVQVVTETARHLSPRGARRAFDPVAAIETAYRLDLDEQDWLAELAVALEPLCDRGLGVSAWLWSYEGNTLRVRVPTYLNCPPDLHDAHTRAAELFSREDIIAT